ncbi:SAM-dependent methyltransferase [Nocardia sp. CDC159]|uniref:SAM-dependent methyltransferase n=1 Tax=Nocardia pulmonis TaxID=2951408 RepID=A0A9X2ED83_9NOCA|nr:MULTISPECIES: SAM-dependent methyltransferase [Nocardia]MCM6778739.1 SAM-dependent methyltransferase [Nocardia pulmonis]MCM6791628.1 SAM-dependent methyltransferase [Nocardia sp. CDC159]
MTRPSWAPEGIDLDRPSASRVYDYFVGGMHNFEIDRTLARQIEAFTPNVAETMRANRDLLRRCVRYLVDAGIDQFLDLGSGIPTVGNVHEVAQARNPAARVIYVDIDPVAVAHSRAILSGNPNAAVVQADVAAPEDVLDDPQVRELLDLDRPVAVLLLGVLHFVPDEADPADCVARLQQAVVPGSYLAITHATADGQPTEVLEAQKLSGRTSTEIVLRSKDQIAAYFHDWSLIEPGLVHLPLWRPEHPADVGAHPESSGAYGGLARKG